LSARLSVKALATVALACGTAYLGWQAWRCGNECLWLHRAQSPGLLALDRAAILEKAFAAEPGNFETAYNIGEAYRLQSFEGNPDYQTQAKSAIGWYARAMKLDPFDGFNYLRTGMCLDWLDRHAEAGPFYRTAELLDPNGYFTAANVGWHYVQMGDYAAAREWLERSLRLEGSDENAIAHSYLDLVERKLAGNASGKGGLPPGF
jgi:tetratricopeptide (TPR) repeat protein